MQDVCGHAAYVAQRVKGPSRSLQGAGSKRDVSKQQTEAMDDEIQQAEGNAGPGASIRSNLQEPAEGTDDTAGSTSTGEHGDAPDLAHAPNSSFPIVRRVTVAVLHALDLTLAGGASASSEAHSRDHEHEDTEEDSGDQGEHVTQGREGDSGGIEEEEEEEGSQAQQTGGQQTASGDLGELLGLVRGAARGLLSDLRALERCSEALRPVLELLHVSKSGGSSMCELARLSNQHNPHFTPGGNCLMKGVFPDTPRWLSVKPEWVPAECAAHHSFQLLPK